MDPRQVEAFAAQSACNKTYLLTRSGGHAIFMAWTMGQIAESARETFMKKQGGTLGNSWMHRLCHLYRTSQGSFLCYYDNDGQTPPFSKEVKARNIIDISKVTQIRAWSLSPNAPEHAFDLVTVERDFTFAPETGDIAAYWLKLLARATEEDVAVVPDEEFAFKLKVVQDSL